MTDRFNVADADGDGALTLAEFQASRQNVPVGNVDTSQRLAELAAKYDADGSGELSAEEIGQLLGDHPRLTSALVRFLQDQEEAEGSPTVEIEEEAVPAGDEAAAEAEGTDETASTETEAPATGSRFSRLFDRLDANNDGSLSLDEFRGLRGYRGNHHHHRAWPPLWMQEVGGSEPVATTTDTETMPTA